MNRNGASGSRSPRITRTNIVPILGGPTVWTFEVSDATQTWTASASVRSGTICDLQAETPFGFMGGTAGTPEVDALVREHITRFSAYATHVRAVVPSRLSEAA